MFTRLAGSASVSITCRLSQEHHHNWANCLLDVQPSEWTHVQSNCTFQKTISFQLLFLSQNVDPFFLLNFPQPSSSSSKASSSVWDMMMGIKSVPMQAQQSTGTLCHGGALMRRVAPTSIRHRCNSPRATGRRSRSTWPAQGISNTTSPWEVRQGERVDKPLSDLKSRNHRRSRSWYALQISYCKINF